MHLISDKLVELVEKHSDVIIKRWKNQITSDPATSAFTQNNMSFIENRAKFILKNLNQYVNYNTDKLEIGKRYVEEGKKIFEMGIPLCEAFRAAVVLRRILWLFIVNESSFDSAFHLHQMRELNDRIILFFDRAHYYLIRGYTEEMNNKIKELWGLDTEATEKIFFKKSFYNK